MKTVAALAVLVLLSAAEIAVAASVSRTYSYFSIGGRTLEEIETELTKRGPQLQGTGQRHPGATQMEFTSRVTYGEGGGWCKVAGALVSVKAKVILPRWRQRAKAEREVRLIWDTLSSDIKRHEESHIIIAKNHARELENALQQLPRRRTCPDMAALVKKTTADILEKHDVAQVRFDKIESMSFEKRLLRLLEYRLQQIEAGRLPG